MHAVHDGLLLCMLWQSGVSFLPDHAMLIIWQCTLTCEVGAMALKSNAWTILFPNQRLCRNLPVSKAWGSILLLLHNHSSTILTEHVPKWKPKNFLRLCNVPSKTMWTPPAVPNMAWWRLVCSGLVRHISGVLPCIMSQCAWVVSCWWHARLAPNQLDLKQYATYINGKMLLIIQCLIEWKLIRGPYLFAHQATRAAYMPKGK